MKYIRVIYLEWLDSETENGWEPIEQADKSLSLAVTIGIYLGETEEFIEVAHSVDPENEAANGRIKIPQSAIKKTRTLCQIQMKLTKK